MKKCYLLTLLVTLFLGACNPLTLLQANTATPTVIPTSTVTPLPTQTPTPKNTATRTPKPTSTQTPTKTVDPRRYYPPDGSFSLVPPEGWETEDIGEDYPALVVPVVGTGNARLEFYKQESEFSVEAVSAILQDSMKEKIKGIESIKEGFIGASDGRVYFRWEFTVPQNGETMHFVIYMFGPSMTEPAGDILIIKYIRLDRQGSEYDTLVEEAMKTLEDKK